MRRVKGGAALRAAPAQIQALGFQLAVEFPVDTGSPLGLLHRPNLKDDHVALDERSLELGRVETSLDELGDLVGIVTHQHLVFDDGHCGRLTDLDDLAIDGVDFA